MQNSMLLVLGQVRKRVNPQKKVAAHFLLSIKKLT
jgi:hypothetical protein